MPVTFLVLPRKVTQRRRPRCAAAHAGPGSGAGKRGCATRPGGPHKTWPAAALEQCSPKTPLACARSAGRRTGEGALRPTNCWPPPPPVRHRVAQAGRGQSDEYVRARGRTQCGSCEFTRRPGLPSSAGEPQAGAPGCAFFGYFLCTSKESNLLPGNPRRPTARSC